MSLASQVEGSSCGATWPDLKLAAFFPSGPRWQMWLEHCAYYYMPPTTTYVCIHICMLVKYVSYLPKVGSFLRFPRFPSSIKLTATIWPKMLKVALNINQSNPIFSIQGKPPSNKRQLTPDNGPIKKFIGPTRSPIAPFSPASFSPARYHRNFTPLSTYMYM